MTLDVCTIVARNYLAQARVLATSFARQHQGQRLKVLVIDAEALDLDETDEPFDVVRPSELPLEPHEFRLMSTIYSALELSTAVKPALVRLLLNRGASTVVYLDPDIEVFAPLDELDSMAEEHGIVLVPHILAPIPDDGRGATAGDIEQAGIFNLGFIAVSSGATDFLEWWDKRLRRDCIVAPERGLFVDQRLMDFAPAYFPHHVLRDPGYDVAYWNLHERDVVWTGDGYQVEGGPLRFFHYSGFNPQKPHLLSKHQGPTPRILLTERAGVARLSSRYAEQLLAAGYSELIDLPYGFGLTADGARIDHRMRWLFRDALLEHESGGGPMPPNPFDDPDTPAFLDWCRQPYRHAQSNISRYLYVAWNERPDLREAFPDILGESEKEFLDWLTLPTSVFDPPLEQQLLPPHVRKARTAALRELVRRGSDLAEETLLGVNVAGYVYAESGVGEAARLMIAGLRAAGVRYSVVPYERTVNRQKNRFDDRGTGRSGQPVNIICINADQLPDFAADAGEAFFRGRYSIGLWFWEVEEFPAPMRGAAALVDEIWVASRHTAAAIAPVVDKPVLVAPLPIIAPEPDAVTRADLSLPDGFLFLFAFDFNSIVERKNPFGLIDAFSRAFAVGEGPTLVIKTVNGHRHVEAYELLEARAADRPDIVLIDRYLDVGEQHALMNHADAYVSLHRSEGFGLTMAEAMALGKPVIATGYSGNIEFMTAWNSYLIPYELQPIGEGSDPYPATARWAEPDLDAAAKAMRSVYDEPQEARRRAERAKADVVRQHSPEELARFLRQRLGEIQRLRRVGSAANAGDSIVLEAVTSRGLLFRTARHVWWALPTPARDVLRRFLFPSSKASTRIPRLEDGNRTGINDASPDRDALFTVALSRVQEQVAEVALAHALLLEHLEGLETPLTATDEFDPIRKILETLESLLNAAEHGSESATMRTVVDQSVEAVERHEDRLAALAAAVNTATKSHTSLVSLVGDLRADLNGKG